MRLASGSSAAVALVAVMAVLTAPARMVAQGSPTGTLTGKVSDPSGGVLQGVTVAARSAQTGLTQQTISGAEGEWRNPALPAPNPDMTAVASPGRWSGDLEDVTSSH